MKNSKHYGLTYNLSYGQYLLTTLKSHFHRMTINQILRFSYGGMSRLLNSKFIHREVIQDKPIDWIHVCLIILQQDT